MNNLLISKEILKNGNTNLIANSELASGSQVFAIGDSHSIFFHNSMKIKEHWFGVNGLPVTIYKLLSSNLDLHNIGNVIGNKHEHYNIRKNDYVIFFYGFNDIQKNIKKYSDANWKNEIQLLFSKYVYHVKLLSKKYEIIPIISCVYPNPRIGAVGQNSYGTEGERIQYTIFANEILKHNCEQNNIIFFNIYDYIKDNFGFIKNEFTKDKIHLDYNNDELRNYIENAVFKFLS
jgi:hypothetical protein